MADIYIGQIKKQKSQLGKEYFKGFIGKIPVICFWGKKSPDAINIKLDVSFINYIAEKDNEDKAEDKNKAEDASKDLPF